MNYGYINYYISNIDECLDKKLEDLKKYASDITVDHLSYRPNFSELMKKVQKGDAIYAHSITRFASGLRDLASILKELNEKEVAFISLEDELTVDQSEKGQAAYHAIIVASGLLNVDPLNGHYM